jgi:hypothetical protein
MKKLRPVIFSLLEACTSVYMTLAIRCIRFKLNVASGLSGIEKDVNGPGLLSEKIFI